MKKYYLDLEGRKTARGENCTMMNFTACILHRILLGWLNQGGWGERDMWHAWGRGEEFTGFWLGGPNVRDHWEDPGVGGRITLTWALGRQGPMGRTGFSWLRIGSGGGLLWTPQLTFGFHKKAGYFLTSWVTISFSNNILHRVVSERNKYMFILRGSRIDLTLQEVAQMFNHCPN
jgi:hypothetical protein